MSRVDLCAAWMPFSVRDYFRLISENPWPTPEEREIRRTACRREVRALETLAREFTGARS